MYRVLGAAMIALGAAGQSAADELFDATKAGDLAAAQRLLDAAPPSTCPGKTPRPH